MDIQTYWHTLQTDWPWSIFSREKTCKTIVPPNSMHIRNFFSDNHYHLYVKYGLALAIKSNQRVDERRSLYNKMQEKRVWQSNFEAFDQLLDSIYGKGYDKSSTIPVDNNFQILDGSHRLAWLAATWIQPTVEVLSHPSHTYNKNWFISNGFTEEEMNLIHSAKRDFFSRYEDNEHNKMLWFIWWSTIQDLGWNWDSILEIIWENNLSNFYIRNFWTILKQIIRTSYTEDGIDGETLANKVDWISERSGGLVWIISYKPESTEEIANIKRKVRTKIRPLLSEYCFDSIIHSIDIPHPLSNKIRRILEKTVQSMNALLYI